MRAFGVMILALTAGLFQTGAAWAGENSVSTLRQPASIEAQTVAYGRYVLEDDQGGPPPEIPYAPVVEPGGLSFDADYDGGYVNEGNGNVDEGNGYVDDGTGCRGECGDPCGCVECCATPFRLFDCPSLRCRGIEVGGWLDQGITLNSDQPANRFNGPVTFNDRSGEYQLNQLYLYAQRLTETRGCGWDLGGRVDFLYGTDSRFLVSDGLDDDWGDSNRFYGGAMPQLYLDVAFNDLTIRMGRFYSILGYESPMAPENFFYSHTYTRQYGEPFTHTGLLAMYDLNDCWSIAAGFDRGWNNWEDNNGDLSFIGRATWTSCDECTSLSFGITSGNEDDAGLNNRTAYSLVFTQQLTSRLRWVLEHAAGWEESVTTQLGTSDVEWYGVTNYLLYELNPCWSLGLRYEWFADDDGARVDHRNATGGPPNGMFWNGVPFQWNDLALGINWTPNPNVTLRSEVRWDWVDLVGGLAPPDRPFDDYNNANQFLWGTDLIIQF